MSKAGKFIQDYTRNCSNELDSFQTKTGAWVDTYHEWLTPDQALRAVEIAREEMIEKACELLVNCIEDFMARRMEIWDEECKKQTLENLRNALKK